ncbi:hypothetical protein J7L65_03960 [Candidatus Bathyarchaeota archaeon]|nr:hypothetical protein [Candidatus Bathyarchaeota archaeon]
MYRIEGVEIMDVVGRAEFERFLWRCISPMPYRRYRRRGEYLERAIPSEKGDSIPPRRCRRPDRVCAAGGLGLPDKWRGIWVMNCIWVLRRAGGRGLGRMLMNRMLRNIGEAAGVATIALEGHHSPWLKLRQMEYLGFKSIDHRRLRHRVKRRDVCLTLHLMWMPLRPGAKPPEMDWAEMLRRVDFCLAHPLYRAESWSLDVVYEPC